MNICVLFLIFGGVFAKIRNLKTVRFNHVSDELHGNNVKPRRFQGTENLIEELPSGVDPSQETVSNTLIELVVDLNHRVKEFERLRGDDNRVLKNLQSELTNIKVQNHKLADKVEVLTTIMRQYGIQFKSDNLSVNGIQVSQSAEPTSPESDIAHNNGVLHASFGDPNLATLSGVKETTFQSQIKRENGLGHHLRRGSLSNTNRPAFHAILGKDIEDPGVGHEITFENIITNIGGAYSEHTGIFRCSVPGLYVFSWTITVYSYWMDTQLVKNGAVIGSTIAASNYHSDVGSGTAVVQLISGDDVWVRVGSHQSSTDIQARFSMFSGFML